MRKRRTFSADLLTPGEREGSEPFPSPDALRKREKQRDKARRFGREWKPSNNRGNLDVAASLSSSANKRVGPHDYDGLVCKNCGERYGRHISTWCQNYPP